MPRTESAVTKTNQGLQVGILLTECGVVTSTGKSDSTEGQGEAPPERDLVSENDKMDVVGE